VISRELRAFLDALADAEKRGFGVVFVQEI